MSTTIGYFFLGTLGGLLAWPCSILTRYHIKNWIQYFFTKGIFLSDAQILRNARFFAKSPRELRILGLLPFILGLTLSILPLILLGNPASIVIFLAIYLMLSGMALEEKTVTKHQFSKEILKQIGASITTNFPEYESEKLFKDWAESKHPNVREAAINGVSALGNEKAIPLLKILVNDKNPTVHLVAFHLLIQHNEIPIAKRKPLVHEKPIIRKKSSNRENDGPKSKPGDWFRAQRKPHQIVEFETWGSKKKQDWAIRKAFPNLYCRDCCRFAEKMTNGLFSLFRCPKCKLDVYLTYGFNGVIGQIGGDHDFVMLKDLIKVQVWDAKLKKSTESDFQTLEIIGGKDIDYDWAINAVVQQLHKEPKRFPHFKVIYKKNPTVSENSKRILNDFLTKTKKSR